MRRYLVLLYQNDTYHFDEMGMPLGMTSKKSFLPTFMQWQKAENPNHAVAILYEEKTESFINSDHYAVYSGYRAWIRFLIFSVFFWKYL